ncbi:MAG: DUF1109 domain-containing protein [Rhodopila sp.]|jgi:hypothetical protein
MLNDQLLERLVTDLKPVRRRSFRGDALIFASLCLIELALFAVLGPTRPDMTMVMAVPSFWWKLGSLGLIALVGAAVAIMSLDPVESPRRGLHWLLGIVAICLAIGWLIDASADGPQALVARVDWHAGLRCVYKMVILSVPPVVGLGLLMRRGAPTDSGGTALAVGIAAAAWGAFVFVFACPHDDPLYVAVWYAVGCGLVTGFARLVLPWLTRW